MRVPILNKIIFLIILKCIVFQNEYVSGQTTMDYRSADEKPSISLQSCSVEMKGLNLKGDKGETGLPGLQGPKGMDGEPGVCKVQCPREVSGYSDPFGDSELTAKKPPLTSCKNSEDKDPEINVWIDNPFEVACTYHPNVYTCLKKTGSVFNTDNRENVSFPLHDQPFWLSKISGSHRFRLDEFYFGYDISKLEYLQQNAVFAIQKIRYHCKNSTVVPKDNPEKALQMLTWKEQLVGPAATNLNPFHYVIEEDGCKDSAGSWNYTDIKLVGHYGRLPILDFYIADTGNENQKFYIELLELCFG